MPLLTFGLIESFSSKEEIRMLISWTERMSMKYPFASKIMMNLTEYITKNVKGNIGIAVSQAHDFLYTVSNWDI